MEVVKLSTRGQFVIPQDMRNDLKLKAGEKLLVIEEEGSIILKPFSKLGKEIVRELADAKMAADAWKDVEKGKVTKYTKAEFLKRMEKW